MTTTTTEQTTVPAIGAVRRLRALAAIGWPNGLLAQRLDVEAAIIRYLIQPQKRWRPKVVDAAIADRIAARFEQMQLMPGPCDKTRRQARSLAWAPPLAWDEEALDDPDARPQYDAILKPRGENPAIRPEVFAEIIAEHRELGRFDEEIAAAMGLTLDALQRRLTRARIPQRTRGAGEFHARTRNPHHVIRLPRPTARRYA